MTRRSARLLLWSPRVLSMLFAGFLVVFAVDAFDGDRSLGDKLLAFATHLMPTYAVLLILLLSWKWPWIGTILYTAFGMFYMREAWGHPVWILAGSGPLYLLALLFLLSWWHSDTIRRTLHRQNRTHLHNTSG